jgi:hypothetical protein
VTAVFAANDHLALGILRALSERGRRVPQDVSVVGFDDVPEAAFFTPPLTTIRPDFAAVAHAGLDLLLAQMDSVHQEPGNVNVSTGEPTVRWDGDPKAPEPAARTTVDSAREQAGRVVLAPRLIVRDSVAPAT